MLVMYSPLLFCNMVNTSFTSSTAISVGISPFSPFVQLMIEADDSKLSLCRASCVSRRDWPKRADALLRTGNLLLYDLFLGGPNLLSWPLYVSIEFRAPHLIFYKGICHKHHFANHLDQKEVRILHIKMMSLLACCVYGLQTSLEFSVYNLNL